MILIDPFHKEMQCKQLNDNIMREKIARKKKILQKYTLLLQLNYKKLNSYGNKYDDFLIWPKKRNYKY